MLEIKLPIATYEDSDQSMPAVQYNNAMLLATKHRETSSATFFARRIAIRTGFFSELQIERKIKRNNIGYSIQRRSLEQNSIQ